MLRALEKDMWQRRAFHHLCSDYEDGFPFEVRLLWRDAMEHVFGSEIPLTPYALDTDRVLLERALRQRLRADSHVIPTLLELTRESVKRLSAESANRRLPVPTGGPVVFKTTTASIPPDYARVLHGFVLWVTQAPSGL